MEVFSTAATAPAATSKGLPDRFTGDVWVDPVCPGAPPGQPQIGIVHFAPGAHTAWHCHINGQTLRILHGRGLVQSRGHALVEVGPGDTIYTPPGEWHWHGATPDHFMTHLAISVPTPGGGDSDGTGEVRPTVEWGTHPTDDEYPTHTGHLPGTHLGRTTP